MNGNKSVLIVIPCYKETLSDFEKISLQQCDRVLSAYDKAIIKPARLEKLPAETDSLTKTNIISFNDDYFNSIQGYNRLMLSKEFYTRFLEYEYILIYQLDAFVFKDELHYWCSQGYDYIGAPWLRAKEYTSFLKIMVHKGLDYMHTRFNIKKDGLPGEKQFLNKVGNGGFSLRRVKRFREICIKMDKQVNNYTLRNEHQFNEDVFWGIEVNRKKKLLHIPFYKEAVCFAIESSPEFAFKLTQNKLPFGCHAWDRYISFWRPVFKELGYIV